MTVKRWKQTLNNGEEEPQKSHFIPFHFQEEIKHVREMKASQIRKNMREHHNDLNVLLKVHNESKKAAKLSHPF